MKDRLTELLERYWEGETSLTEETELKSLLKKSDLHPELNAFFSGIERLGRIENGNLGIRRSKKVRHTYLFRIAAVFIGLVLLSSILYNKYHQREQEKAYLQVMAAFTLIQSNMEKGTEELQMLDELRLLNMPHELFSVNELNEQ